jgi:hypothetical protein
MRSAAEEWIVDLLGEWQQSGQRFFPEDVALEIISHLAVSPLRFGPDGLPLLPTEEAAFAEMESRNEKEGPFWLNCIPYQNPVSGK